MTIKSVQCSRISKALLVLMTALIFVMPSVQPVHGDSNVVIPVKVSFEGSSLPTETFTIQMMNEDSKDTVKSSITLSKGKTSGTIHIQLGDLKTGAYSYELKEVKGSNSDITYSDKVYKYTIIVKADGTVEHKAVNSSDPNDKPDLVELANSFHKSDEEVIGDPPVRIRKQISGNKPPKVSRFMFEMRPEKPEYPLPDVKTAKSGRIVDGAAEVYLNGEGEVEIGNITFKEEGVYRYFVAEKDKAVEGYDYDDARFTVVYEVSRDQNGTLTCKRTIKKKGESATEDCTFDNIYDPNPVTRKLRRAIKTGDPSVMWPLTAACVALIVIVAMLLDRRNRREARRERKKG